MANKSKGDVKKHGVDQKIDVAKKIIVLAGFLWSNFGKDIVTTIIEERKKK